MGDDIRQALSWHLELGFTWQTRGILKVSTQHLDYDRCLSGDQQAAGQGWALGAARRQERGARFNQDRVSSGPMWGHGRGGV